jgi:hypothetical protein
MKTPAEILDMFPAAKAFLRSRSPLMSPLDAGKPLQIRPLSTLLSTGLLPFDVLPQMGLVETAPCHYVDACLLRWHPRLRELVVLDVPEAAMENADMPSVVLNDDGDAYELYPTPGSGTPEVPWRRLGQLGRLLSRGDGASLWRQSDDDWTAERFSVELNCTISVVCTHLSPPYRWVPTGLLMPPQVGQGLRFMALASNVKVAADGSTYDCFVLTDLDNEAYVPVFRTLAEGCRMVDAALWHELTQPDDENSFQEPPRLRWLPGWY